mmetsp:Transcript_59725/g.69819  ORF Transcript_59725/g.69819 Transcript_59725/m.69819 type:complete len:102 (+) Transcript_59725:1531-1836(+)
MDEWPVRSGRFHRGPVVVEEQPRCASARCNLAQKFAAEFGIEDLRNWLVDDPEEEQFEEAYAPWPLRLWLIGSDGKVRYAAEPKQCSYDHAVTHLVGLLGL